MDTYMSIITTLLSRNVSKLHWQSKFFSVPSWSNKAPYCYACWMAPTSIPTNIVNILYVIMWIEVNVQDMNFLKGGRWLHRELANETTGAYLFKRLWTLYDQIVWNRVNANPGLTLINTYRLSWYSPRVIFLNIIFQFAHCFPTASN